MSYGSKWANELVKDHSSWILAVLGAAWLAATPCQGAASTSTIYVFYGYRWVSCDCGYVERLQETTG